jgi:hypothetical protein
MRCDYFDGLLKKIKTICFNFLFKISMLYNHYFVSLLNVLYCTPVAFYFRYKIANGCLEFSFKIYGMYY